MLRLPSRFFFRWFPWLFEGIPPGFFFLHWFLEGLLHWFFLTVLQRENPSEILSEILSKTLLEILTGIFSSYWNSERNSSQDCFINSFRVSFGIYLRIRSGIFPGLPFETLPRFHQGFHLKILHGFLPKFPNLRNFFKDAFRNSSWASFRDSLNDSFRDYFRVFSRFFYRLLWGFFFRLFLRFFSGTSTGFFRGFLQKFLPVSLEIYFHRHSFSDFICNSFWKNILGIPPGFHQGVLIRISSKFFHGLIPVFHLGLL